MSRVGDRGGSAMESAARLSAARVAEFQERLNELIEEFFGPEAAEWTSRSSTGFDGFSCQSTRHRQMTQELSLHPEPTA